MEAMRCHTTLCHIQHGNPCFDAAGPQWTPANDVEPAL